MIEGSDPLKWEDFNSDYTSSTMDHKPYKELCREHDQDYIYLGAYMNFKPYVVSENTDLQKILSIFKLMNLRHLPVIDNEDGRLKGIITRKDLIM